MTASETRFKGNPMLVLSRMPDDQFPFTFGLNKAKLIIAHFEDIKEFVNKHENLSKEE